MTTSLRTLLLVAAVVGSGVGCFDWTIPAGVNLSCGEGEGCPDGWLCDRGYCISSSCGNGELDPGEECDNANANNDELTGLSVCRTNCRRPYCGDGVIDEGEACDDGVDGDNSDGCSTICTRVGSCGDGKIQEALESCEDGNQVSGDGCSSDCVSEEGFVMVSAGTVVMGQDGLENASPTLEFEMTHDFLILDHEVTQSEWLQVMGEFRGSGPFFIGCDDCPVESVSWFDALAYCNTRSRQEGLKPCYGIEPGQELFSEATITFSGLECTGYRLPLEAEWEFAVRGGEPLDQGRFYGGADAADTFRGEGCQANIDLESAGWYCANSWQDPLDMWATNESHIHIGKQKDPNSIGAYDMLGNVWEWVWDNWQPFADRRVDGAGWPITGPEEGEDRVKRGGGYFNSASDATMATRQPHSPNSRDSSIGFRVVRTAPPSEGD